VFHSGAPTATGIRARLFACSRVFARIRAYPARIPSVPTRCRMAPTRRRSVVPLAILGYNPQFFAGA
jgi:hypothetical protein